LFVVISSGFTLAAEITSPTDSSSNRIVQINEIFIIGNKKTQEGIILREIDVEKSAFYGLQELRLIAEEGRMNIYNTNLFNQVEVNILETTESDVDILIKVIERWYFYPSPIFRIADRNLMDWLRNRSGELNRFNYGLKLDKYNFRGRNERIRFIGEIGFERRFILNYAIPYIERSQRHGLIIDLAYTEREDMAYITEDHLPSFIESEDINRTAINTAVTYTYRPTFYFYHHFTAGFRTAAISDTIASLNPNYFSNGSTLQRAFRLRYRFINDLRNNRNFPTTGHYLLLEAQKQGLGIYNELNIFSLMAFANKYHDLGSGFYLANGIIALASFPQNQPYDNYFGLGYEEIIGRGFELDVIEGPSYVLSKNSIRKLLFNARQDISNVVKMDQFNDVKLAMYAKFFADIGWVDNYPQYEISSRLTNTFLYSLGLGVDMVTMYDLVLRFEYSYNSASELNFAINIKADI
jgi:outer membrane protein assembly factor BamA